jgi:hypothetical protein
MPAHLPTTTTMPQQESVGVQGAPAVSPFSFSYLTNELQAARRGFPSLSSVFRPFRARESRPPPLYSCFEQRGAFVPTTATPLLETGLAPTNHPSTPFRATGGICARNCHPVARNGGLSTHHHLSTPILSNGGICARNCHHIAQNGGPTTVLSPPPLCLAFRCADSIFFKYITKIY